MNPVKNGGITGAGATYYLLKKDDLDIKDQANQLWDKTKIHGENLVEKMDDYFEEGKQREQRG